MAAIIHGRTNCEKIKEKMLWKNLEKATKKEDENML